MVRVNSNLSEVCSGGGEMALLRESISVLLLQTCISLSLSPFILLAQPYFELES